MKILHTADWHIGKTLYKQSLNEELSLFFDWVINKIEKEKIDILLISGDIFDLGNPSNSDKAMYYSVLNKLKKIGVATVVTAGNHDSPSFLEAPGDLIRDLDIYVVGYGHQKDQQIITLENSQDEKVHILAVPFLREGDVRKSRAGEGREDKIKGLREGIVDHYKRLSEKVTALDDSVPVIAMGHMFIQGASTSDSERDIQVGNLAGIGADQFTGLFNYLALGHIHRPQKLNENGTVRYSGSPIPLSFSERNDIKQVVVLEVEDQKLTGIRAVEVPLFRPLIRVIGSLEQVKKGLSHIKKNTPFPPFVEIQVEEEKQDQSKLLETISMAETVSQDYIIISYKVVFEENINSMSALGMAQQVDELTPKEVFARRIEGDEFSDEDRENVLVAFEEVLTELDGEK